MIDLDDMSIYLDKWKEMTTWQLWNEGWTEAGRSLFYMKYIHPDMEGTDQWNRVDKLCNELMILWKHVGDDSPEHRLIFMKWLYRFQDEAENQC
jgi:hypothetical protein